MEIVINQTIGSKKEDIFGLYDNGNILIKNDKVTLIAASNIMKDAIAYIDHLIK